MSCRGLAKALACLVTVSPTLSYSADVTIASWGGAYGESQFTAAVRPFASETGVYPYFIDSRDMLNQVRMQAESGAVEWDVVDMSAVDVARGCDEGYLMQIDVDSLYEGTNGQPPQEDFFKRFILPCGIPTVVWSLAIATSPLLSSSVESLTVDDFFDLERFPGQRGLRRQPQGALEWALIADGVEPTELYDVLATEEGLDRAFARLDTIKHEIFWWRSSAQVVSMLAAGELAMSAAYSSQVWSAQEEGFDLGVIWDGQILEAGYWTVPAASSNIEVALEFIRYSTQPDRLALQSSMIGYGPARASSIDLVDEYSSVRMAEENLPTSPGNISNAITSNHLFWSENGDQILQRFEAWISQN